nr:MAG TPA: hypothetical protein [Caudoviricetes sp.]
MEGLIFSDDMIKLPFFVLLKNTAKQRYRYVYLFKSNSWETR